MADTDKDNEYLGRLQDYYASNRSLPSYAKLCILLGFASKAAVSKLLNRLLLQGFLRRAEDGDWVPDTRFFERAVSTHAVQAGLPAEARDVGSDYFAIDHYLVEKPSRTLLIPVKGDSMIDAGIHAGDLAVVERRNTANVGDIVVAIVDNEFTLKTLGREGKQFVLLPANPAYPVIRPKGELEVFGVMVGLVRKFNT